MVDSVTNWQVYGIAVAVVCDRCLAGAQSVWICFLTRLALSLPLTGGLHALRRQIVA
jgi:hypothetical protein